MLERDREGGERRPRAGERGERGAGLWGRVLALPGPADLQEFVFLLFFQKELSCAHVST